MKRVSDDVRVTISFPRKVYEKLRVDAFKQRTSIAHLTRQLIATSLVSDKEYDRMGKK